MLKIPNPRHISMQTGSTERLVQGSDNAAPMEDADSPLAQRVEAVHLRRRLALEAEYERHVRRPTRRPFHFETWYSVHSLIRNSLRLVGLHARARRNARALCLRQHDVWLPGLPPAFERYAILHISDPHLDTSDDIPQALIDSVRDLNYDLCVLTGDYRTRTFGPYGPTLRALARVREYLKSPVYAVLGNHDSIRMVPEMEALGIRVLLNESVIIERGKDLLHLAGIEDAHYYRLHDVDRVAPLDSPRAVSILLSHTPEAYREAARAGFHLMLSGHTHGGQICLPGGFPLITDTTDCPRAYTKGAWRHENLIGYTSSGSGASIVDVRLNCPPEVTLHRLRRV